MKKLYEVAGQVMGFFDAFKGSKPAIDNDKILIVRGKSRKTYPIDQLEEKLTQVGQEIGGEEISSTSEEITEILETGDKQIQSSEENTTAVDTSGFSRMKEELESMGLVVAYKVFKLPTCNVVIAIWEDKSEIPPLYVEVTVSDKEE